MIGVAAAIAVFTAGCAAEDRAAESVRILRGEVHSAEGAISIETDDWTYGVPLDGVRWTDADNVWHDGGRPDCLPPIHAPAVVTFAAVEVSVEGSTWRPVVWVDCRDGGS